MHISSITSMNLYKHNQPQKRLNTVGQPSFKSGKVNAYFDFDLTYCPVSQENLRLGTCYDKKNFRKYCESFAEFTDEAGDDFKFHVTTGRTLAEYEIISRLIRKCGYKLPLPSSVITKNGSDEYIKSAKDDAFYVNGDFPFSKKSRNISKEEDINALTNWRGPEIQKKVREILNSYDFKIFDADSEMPVVDQGDKSLFYNGRLRYEHNIQLKPGMPPTSDWNVGIRNDGNCKIFFTLPYDMLYCKERTEVLNDILAKINDYLAQTNTRAYVRLNRSEVFCASRPSVVIEPLVDSDIEKCQSVPKSDKGLAKFYDTRLAVRGAEENNDLVIVAGDGSNDFTMLNPAMYLDIDADKYPKLYNLLGSPQEFLEELENNKEKYAEISARLENLPFVGIVVETDGQRHPLDSIVRAYGSGKYKKIIMVENAMLESGIKEAIKAYSKQNPKFEEQMGINIFQAIC